MAACASSPGASQPRRDRLALIRDTAAQMGVHNAALFAGIAMSETSLAHCWSEATYACQGPASPSCAGGPVIAGSADGPCSAMQGGLGLFQLDAGTWSDTVARYGDAVLTIEGNAAHAVSFVIDAVMVEVAGANTWLAAAGWLDGVPLDAGDPVMAQWASLVACRYNGCCSQSALCGQRAGKYRDDAIELHGELGAAFWATANRCAGLPADGVIDQRTACYVAGGDPAAWHAEAAGYGGSREWTASDAPDSFARWILRVPGPGRYRIEVDADGGDALASYEVGHAGGIDTVAVDQSVATGFVVLGEFSFAGGEGEYVALSAGGGPGKKLVFDAVRVTAAASGVSDARGKLRP